MPGMRVWPSRVPSFALFALAMSVVPACNRDHDEGAPGADRVDEYFYDCQDPKRPAALASFATDESLVKLLEKEDAGSLVMKDEEAATLTAPAAGSSLSAAAPPAFALAPPATSARIDPEAPPPTPVRPHPGRMRLLRRAWGWLAPIGTAWAHCMPVTGDNYLFRLSTSDNKQIYAALLSVTTFTPGVAAWIKAFAGLAGQSVHLTLLRASYTGGTITAGPFVSSKTVSFTVAP
jgi:hypothetical protein